MNTTQNLSFSTKQKQDDLWFCVYMALMSRKKRRKIITRIKAIDEAIRKREKDK